MNGLCPCGQGASRRLCMSLCVSKESPLRRSLKVLCLPQGRYREELDSLVREISERTESRGDVFRIADSHFEPGLMTKKFTVKQQVPTQRFVLDGAGGGTSVDYKAAQTAPTPVKPATRSKLALDRLAEPDICGPLHSATRDVELVRSRLTSLHEESASLEETVANLQRRVAELEEKSRHSWTAYQSGKSPCFRWDRVVDSPASVIYSLTGLPNAAIMNAFHDLLNAEHMLDDVVIAVKSDLRTAVTKAATADGFTGPGGAAAAPGGAALPGGVAAHVAVAGIQADATSTPATGKRPRDPVVTLFVDKSSCPGERKRTLSTRDALFLVFFILQCESDALISLQPGHFKLVSLLQLFLKHLQPTLFLSTTSCRKSSHRWSLVEPNC